MTEKEVIEILKALSVRSRIKIIKLIRDRKFCVNAIARNLGITQSAVSQHLRVLKDSNIVYSERYGSIIHYQLKKEKIEEFINVLSKILTGSQK
jgi:DNA-binding transcriptional ArsR family regulator